MAKAKFQFDATALVPDKVTVDLAPFTGSEQPDVVEFFEFARTDLTDFVAESLELKIIETEKDGSPKKGEDGKEVRRSFKDVEATHADFLFKYLSVGTRGTKSADFFAKLPLTASAMAALVEMLLKLNHVDEVLATSGNWLMLPTVMEILAAADEKTSESATPNPILPA